MKKWESEYYIQIHESLIKPFLTFLSLYSENNSKSELFCKKTNKKFSHNIIFIYFCTIKCRMVC